MLPASVRLEPLAVSFPIELPLAVPGSEIFPATDKFLPPYVTLERVSRFSLEFTISAFVPSILIFFNVASSEKIVVSLPETVIFPVPVGSVVIINSPLFSSSILIDIGVDNVNLPVESTDIFCNFDSFEIAANSVESIT